MSKGYNANGLYVDTGLLRDHVSKLQSEKKLASRLYQNIVFMKNLADPMVAHRYDSLLRDIKQLIEYFDAMSDQLARTADEATRLSYELRYEIKDSTELSQRIISKSFLL